MVVLLNLILPGSGLILRDRLWLGCGLLLLSLLAVAVVIAAGTLASGPFVATLRLGALLGYGFCALVAGCLWWLLESATVLPDTELRTAHARISRAWLDGEEAKARQEARQLTRRAPRLGAAWDLLAVVGEPAEAQRAHKRARWLRQQRQ